MKKNILGIIALFCIVNYFEGLSQNVGIGIATPTQKLHVNGTLRIDNAFMPNNLPGANGEFLMSQGAGVAPVWRNLNAVSDTTNWRLIGNSITSSHFIGTLNAFDFITRTNNVERMRVIGTAGATQGFVGINTTAPSERLHVNGNMRIDNAFMPGNTAGTTGQLLLSQGAGIAPVWRNFTALSDTTNWRLIGNTITSAHFIGTLNAFDFITRTNNVERMRVIGTAGATQGFVGINAAAPTERLHVIGNMRLDNAFMPGNTAGTTGQLLLSQGAGIAPVWRNFTALSDTTNWRLIGNSITSAHFIGTLNAFDFITRTNNVERMRVVGTAGATQGFVGINAAAPTERLHVIGNMRLDNAFMPGNTAGTTGQLLLSQGAGIAPVWRNFTALSDTTNWRLIGNTITSAHFIGTLNAFDFITRTNNVERMRVVGTAGATQGFVGINAAAPTERLHVIGNMRLDNAFMPGNTAGTTGQLLLSQGAGIAPVWRNFTALSDTTNWRLIGNSITSANFIGTLNAFDFITRTNNVERMRVIGIAGATQGFVGINTAAPTERLHVNGNLRFDNALMPNNIPGANNQVLTSMGPGVAPQWRNFSALADTTAWRLVGNTLLGTEFIGSLNNFDFIMRTNNVARVWLKNTGLLGINTNTPTALTHINAVTGNTVGLRVTSLDSITANLITNGIGNTAELTNNAGTGGYVLKLNTVNAANANPTFILENNGQSNGMNLTNYNGVGTGLRLRMQNANVGQGINLQMLTPSSTATGFYLQQKARGRGMHIDVDSVVNTNEGLYINHKGTGTSINLVRTNVTGSGITLTMPANSTGDGLNITHGGTAGYGSIVTRNGTSGVGSRIVLSNGSNASTALEVVQSGSGIGINASSTNSATVIGINSSTTGTAGIFTANTATNIPGVTFSLNPPLPPGYVTNFKPGIGVQAAGAGHGINASSFEDGNTATDHDGGIFYVRQTNVSNVNLAVTSVAALINNTVYKVIGLGTVSTLVKDNTGNLRIMSAPETPEVLLQDFGRGQLINGKAHIIIDSTLARNIKVDEAHPMEVFIQLKGDCKGVYVTNETQYGFDVIELQGGSSNVEFSWFLSANRANEVIGEQVIQYENNRFKLMQAKGEIGR